MTKLIVNVETGETVKRELNKNEKDQQKIDEAEIAEALIIAEAKDKPKAQAKAEAESKLAALGLTTDDLRALGL